MEKANNYELLRDNNRHLFGVSGLFRDIEVRDVDNPAYDQLHFAEVLLSEFNSRPDHLGFAILQPDGVSVKIYAYDIKYCSGLVSLSERINPSGLGGIIINKPLIFKSLADVLYFSSSERDYTASIDGQQLILQHVKREDKPLNIIRIYHPATTTIDEETFNCAVDFIKNCDKFSRFRKATFSFVNYSTLLNLDKMRLSHLISDLDESVCLLNSDYAALYDFLSRYTISLLNVKDRVSLSRHNYTADRVVAKIEGSNVTLDDGSVIDLRESSLYKERTTRASCVYMISIPYAL